MVSNFTHCGRPSAKGFTLTELLTVIAIIGVLSAILIPTIGKIRSTAQSATCVSNLRQLGAACLLYSSENSNRLVPMAATIDGVTKTWRAHVAPYVGNSIDVFICPSNSKEAGVAFTASQIVQIGTGIRPISYGLNSYWNNLDSALWLHEYIGKPSAAKLAVIQNPSGMILLSDIGLVANPSADPSEWVESLTGANFGYARMPNDPAFRGGDAWNIFPRHGASTNVVYYDGHVGAVNVARDILPHSPGSTDCLYDNL